MTKKQVTIHIHINQLIDEDEVDSVVNKYVDELAKTNGELSWDECDWSTADAVA